MGKKSLEAGPRSGEAAAISLRKFTSDPTNEARFADSLDTSSLSDRVIEP